MVISKGVSSRCELFVDGVKIKQAESFTYLESVINGKTKCNEEIKEELKWQRMPFKSVKNSKKSKGISQNQKGDYKLLSSIDSRI